MVVIGGIVGEAWPQVALEQLQVLQDQQRRVGKVDILQLVPQLLLDDVRAHLGRLLGGQPVLPGDLRKVVLAVQVGDGRTGVHQRGGRRTLDAVHGGRAGVLQSETGIMGRYERLQSQGAQALLVATVALQRAGLRLALSSKVRCSRARRAA